MPPEIGKDILQLIAKSLDNYSVEKIEYSLLFDDVTKYFEAQFYPSWSNEVVSIIRNITHRKNAEEKMSQLVKKLTSANKELQDFAFVVSHDLKAPLKAIGMILGFLISENKDNLSDEIIPIIFRGFQNWLHYNCKVF